MLFRLPLDAAERAGQGQRLDQTPLHPDPALVVPDRGELWRSGMSSVTLDAAATRCWRLSGDGGGGLLRLQPRAR